MEIGKTDDTICPGYDVVNVLSFKTGQGHIVPVGLDPSSIFYGMSFKGTSLSPEVSFKIDNPFSDSKNMLIQYHKHPTGSTRGALDPACNVLLAEPGCNPTASAITAGCVAHEGKQPFTLITVFFVDDVLGSSDPSPYECCPIPAADKGKKLIEYTFKVLCSCPVSPSLRGLLVADSEDLALWEQYVGTRH
jgi:hypothetical protein